MSDDMIPQIWKRQTKSDFEANVPGLFSFFYSVFKTSPENQAVMLKISIKLWC